MASKPANSTLEAIAKRIRLLSIKALKQSQSGHPGGSLSSADILATLYGTVLSKTGEPFIISNGHISPGVYAALATAGYAKEKEFVETFRQLGSKYEGHVTRHVPGVWYGTGPLGIGLSAATGFALAAKKKKEGNVYCLMGDGEFQEGIVHEAMHMAATEKLNNFCVLVDYNQVQLSGSLKDIMPVNIKLSFRAAGWKVVEADGHDVADLRNQLEYFQKQEETMPMLILCHTVMGKGVSFMEKDGKALKATWHGKAPKPEDADTALAELALSKKEEAVITSWKKQIKWKPKKQKQPALLAKTKLKIGKPHILEAGTITDCRSAYGYALLDLAKRNKHVIAMTADLRGSVKTQGVANELPEQHIEVGIAEQQLVSSAGGLSLYGFTPFVSTFGAFMTSRAKDQARVNDINGTNVNMVATHCGLSVGEDGPTHQAIDDMGSMLGLLDTLVMEPSDANQTDHMIRFAAGHYGNTYIRMGRHKFPVIEKEEGGVFYDEHYSYYYGRTDLIRPGSMVALVATGACVVEALGAKELLEQDGISTAVIAVSSIKEFDRELAEHLAFKELILTVEDHNTRNGLGSTLPRYLLDQGISVSKFHALGVDAYQLSGTAEDLYHHVGIDSIGIAKKVCTVLAQ